MQTDTTAAASAVRQYIGDAGTLVQTIRHPLTSRRCHRVSVSPVRNSLTFDVIVCFRLV